MGLLTNRGRVSGRRSMVVEGQHQSAQEEEEDVDTTSTTTNEFEGLWMYPEILDIVALAVALLLGVSTAAVCSFGYDEIQAADVRYIKEHEGRYSYWISGASGGDLSEFPVSNALMQFAAWATVFSSSALLSAVLVRIITTYAIHMPLGSERRSFILKWANPLSIIVVLIWVFSVIVCAGVIYWLGWVIFPPEIANGNAFLAAGICFLSVVFLLFALALYLVGMTRWMGKKEDKMGSARQRRQENPPHQYEQQQQQPTPPQVEQSFFKEESTLNCHHEEEEEEGQKDQEGRLRKDPSGIGAAAKSTARRRSSTVSMTSHDGSSI